MKNVREERVKLNQEISVVITQGVVTPTELEKVGLGSGWKAYCLIRIYKKTGRILCWRKRCVREEAFHAEKVDPTELQANIKAAQAAASLKWHIFQVPSKELLSEPLPLQGFVGFCHIHGVC